MGKDIDDFVIQTGISSLGRTFHCGPNIASSSSCYSQILIGLILFLQSETLWSLLHGDSWL